MFRPLQSGWSWLMVMQQHSGMRVLLGRRCLVINGTPQHQHCPIGRIYWLPSVILMYANTRGFLSWLGATSSFVMQLRHDRLWLRFEACFGMVLNIFFFKDYCLVGYDVMQNFTDFLEEYIDSIFRALPDYTASYHRRYNFHSYGCRNLRSCSVSFLKAKKISLLWRQ